MNYYVCHVEYRDGDFEYLEVCIVATREPEEKVTHEYCLKEIFGGVKPALVFPFYELEHSYRWVRITDVQRIESKEDLKTLRAYGVC